MKTFVIIKTHKLAAASGVCTTCIGIKKLDSFQQELRYSTLTPVTNIFYYNESHNPFPS